jgi:hypothetical protein
LDPVSIAHPQNVNGGWCRHQPPLSRGLPSRLGKALRPPSSGSGKPVGPRSRRFPRLPARDPKVPAVRPWLAPKGPPGSSFGFRHRPGGTSSFRLQSPPAGRAKLARPSPSAAALRAALPSPSHPAFRRRPHVRVRLAGLVSGRRRPLLPPAGLLPRLPRPPWPWLSPGCRCRGGFVSRPRLARSPRKASRSGCHPSLPSVSVRAAPATSTSCQPFRFGERARCLWIMRITGIKKT